jgi:hypothetical protein
MLTVFVPCILSHRIAYRAGQGDLAVGALVGGESVLSQIENSSFDTFFAQFERERTPVALSQSECCVCLIRSLLVSLDSQRLQPHVPHFFV